MIRFYRLLVVVTYIYYVYKTLLNMIARRDVLAIIFKSVLIIMQ